jgi:hypothetical protein
MKKTLFLKTALLTWFLAVTFASCKKEVNIEPATETKALVSNSTSLLLSSTARFSSLTGTGLMLGINGHLGDAPYLATPPAKQIELLNERGITWYRLNVQTLSDGTASASKLLEALQTAATNGGVKILPMLYLRNLNYADSEAISYEKGKLRGANFAAKYGQYFTYYNLGNDLELPLLMPLKTGQSESHYYREKFNVVAAYLKGMDEGIKSQDTDAKTMITAGWLHYGFLRMCEWYGVKFDIVSYNWYSDMEVGAAKGPKIPDITLKLSALFPKKPIWFTEFNYRYKTASLTNEADQNTFVTNFLAKCKANPQVKVAMVYQLFDEPYKTGDEGSYGILKWPTPYTYTQHIDKVLSQTFLNNVVN